MLALQSPRQKSDQCVPNVVPCRIQHTGPVKVTKRFWAPSTEPDGTRISYFRGRKLRGRTVRLPAGYRGVAAQSLGRMLPQEYRRPPVKEDHGGSADDEDEDEDEDKEPIKILETVSSFDHVTVWGHDILPAADDPFVKGVEEWIAFAEAIHGKSTKPAAEGQGGEGHENPSKI